jgi:hypothetical protein
MRSYSRNSLETSTRIFALMLIADGHVFGSEDKAPDKT